MALDKYNQKRKFDQTPEPKGENSKSKDKLTFVIQRHSASRLHYDFRLEMDGVLKSWAIPKGPSLNAADKRLAMMTEDHPFSYKDFEGTIPEGNYGGGEVEIWDSGTYQPAERTEAKSDDLVMQKELNEGSLKFKLHGEKLNGEFALVKIKKPKQKNAWLLIKHKDEWSKDSYDAEDHLSSASKVSLREKAREAKSKKKEGKKRRKLVEADQDAESKDKKLKNFIIPMFAKTAVEPFDHPDWIFETKWDGYRGIGDLTKTQIQLYSRNGLSYANKFPLVVNALQNQKSKMILDGEIVAWNKNDQPDFQALQKLSEHPDIKVTFQVFDLLEIDGKSTEHLPLIERKRLLKKALIEDEVVQYCGHIPEKGIEFFAKVKDQKLEGMLAKKADSIYVEGARSTNWLKVKFQNTEEVLICGYTQPKGSRQYFGALILGTFINGKLTYCGHAGTGFSNDTLKNLQLLFDPLVVSECPFAETPKTNTAPVWLEPKLVGEIKYTERTQDGVFRHPVFMGLRNDKEKKDVKKQSKEEGKSIATSTIMNGKKAKEKKPKTGKERILKAGKNVLTLTSQNKIYFPESGITKGDLIDYYQSVADYILPYLKNRPQSLHRFPNGIKAAGFYHKDAGDDAPGFMKKFAVYSESSDKEIQYLLCNTSLDLAYLNNLGCIEMNPWNSTVKNLDQPDWLALDLDPSKNNSFDHVVEVSLAVKELLDQLKIKGYCKTSGSSGIHIFLPMNAKYEFNKVKDFAHLLMKKVNAMLPDLTTLERSLKKREKGKIYLDYLQNSTGQTLASVYSVRPTENASVSMPLLWEEVQTGLSPDDFTIHNALVRIKEKGDLFKPVLEKGINLKKALKSLEAL